MSQWSSSIGTVIQMIKVSDIDILVPFLQTPFCCTVFGFAETERVAEESGFQESIDVTLIKGPVGYRTRNLLGRFTISAVSTNASMSISVART